MKIINYFIVLILIGLTINSCSSGNLFVPNEDIKAMSKLQLEQKYMGLKRAYNIYKQKEQHMQDESDRLQLSSDMYERQYKSRNKNYSSVKKEYDILKERYNDLKDAKQMALHEHKEEQEKLQQEYDKAKKLSNMHKRQYEDEQEKYYSVKAQYNARKKIGQEITLINSFRQAYKKSSLKVIRTKAKNMCGGGDFNTLNENIYTNSDGLISEVSLTYNCK